MMSYIAGQAPVSHLQCPEQLTGPVEVKDPAALPQPHQPGPWKGYEKQRAFSYRPQPLPEILLSWITGPPSWTRLRLGRWGAKVF